MLRSALPLALALLAAGCVGMGPRFERADAADAGVAEATLTATAEALRTQGGIRLATADAGPQLARCAGANGQGVVGFTLASVTPGRPFALRATGANANAQDLDIIFLRAAPSCLTDAPASPAHGNANGNEAGFVPLEARAAIVWLFSGADATFAYTEFAPLAPATTTLAIEDTLRFRMVRIDAESTYHDMYEPHVAVAGTGAIYVAGHTTSSDTLRSPMVVSLDEGATWTALPDPAPIPAATSAIPGVGGRVGQGNEGGIAADGTGRAWLYDAAWIAGSAPLYSWCDDGARSCGFDPVAFDHTALSAPCGDWPAPRTLDKPWASFGHGSLLLANVGLPLGFVDEFRAASMLGLYDPDSGERAWNGCVGVGGMPGIPAIRDTDGTIAVPQVQRTPEGEGWMAVHHGASLDAMETSPPIVRTHRSWQPCGSFNGYGDFSGAGTYYLFSATSAGQAAVSATSDFEAFDTLTFDVDGMLRYMWLAGDPRGEGALLTWGVADACGEYDPVTFYAAHLALGPNGLEVRDASIVASDVAGTCGHYMGSDVGPDGRAYLVVHASQGGCLGAQPMAVPLLHAPWRLYVQDLT